MASADSVFNSNFLSAAESQMRPKQNEKRRGGGTTSIHGIDSSLQGIELDGLRALNLYVGEEQWSFITR